MNLLATEQYLEREEVLLTGLETQAEEKEKFVGSLMFLRNGHFWISRWENELLDEDDSLRIPLKKSSISRPVQNGKLINKKNSSEGNGNGHTLVWKENVEDELCKKQNVWCK